MTIQPEIHQTSGGVWNIPATIGLSLVVWLVFNLAGFVMVRILLAYYSATDPAFDSAQFALKAGENGHVLALVTLVSAPLCTALTAMFARLRRGLSLQDYLALNFVKPAVVLKWSVVLVVTMLAVEFATKLTDHPVASDYAVNAYRTATILPLFWLAVTLVGPLFEEVLFRGFLYKGIAVSRLGIIGAILLSSLVWTLVHFQYDKYELSVVFILGTVLGLARAKTHSLYVPLVLHSLVNITALMTASLS